MSVMFAYCLTESLHLYHSVQSHERLQETLHSIVDVLVVAFSSNIFLIVRFDNSKYQQSANLQKLD